MGRCFDRDQWQRWIEHEPAFDHKPPRIVNTVRPDYFQVILADGTKLVKRWAWLTVMYNMASTDEIAQVYLEEITKL